MKDSEVISRANQIISEIYSLLRDRFLRELIDLPIEKVVNEFDRSVPAEVTPVQFHEIIAAFVQLLYAQGLRLPLRLERDQALAEAIHLLDAGYSSNTGTGYSAGLTDVRWGGRMALSAVLASLAETLKARERRRHLRYVLVAKLEGIDWRVRRGIARIVERRIASFLPPREGHPVRVVTAAGIAGFILADMATDSLCDGVLQSGFGQTPR